MLNFLAAYPYCTANMMAALQEHKADVRFLLDSGAFTAWKVGKSITLDEYCQFIETCQPTPWRYFMLDVIGDPHATRRNYDEMRRRGFNPVPIFTRGEDPRALDDYFDSSDMVGLGGLAGTGQQPYGYLKWLWPQLNGRKVHILGFSALPWMKFFKPYSCDSSSWETGARYARLLLYVGRGQIVQLQRKDFETRPAPRVMRAIARLGFDPALLSQEKGWRGGYSATRWISAASWVALQRDIETNLGTLFFLACAAGDRAPQMLASCHRYQTTGDWSSCRPTDVMEVAA